MTTVAMICGIVIDHVWPSPDWRFCTTLGLLGLCLLIFSLYEKGRILVQSEIANMEIKQKAAEDAKDAKSKQDAAHEAHKQAMNKISNDWLKVGRHKRKGPWSNPP